MTEWCHYWHHDDVSRSFDALVAEMKLNPEGVRFVDACRVATHFFGEPRQRGTSHHVWRMPWPGDPRVNIQRGDNGKAKAYQVRQLVRAIETLRPAERADDASAER